MGRDFDYLGLDMGDWREVVNAYAKSEPCRPFVLRGTTEAQRIALVAKTLRLDSVRERTIVDYAGAAVRLQAASLPPKLGRYANHAAYAGWIESTLRDPLEVWRHRDPRKPGSSLRDYLPLGVHRSHRRDEPPAHRCGAGRRALQLLSPEQHGERERRALRRSASCWLRPAADAASNAERSPIFRGSAPVVEQSGALAPPRATTSVAFEGPRS